MYCVHYGDKAMKLGLSDAIVALRPNSDYIVRGDTYSGLEWDSNNTQTKPTEEEVNAKFTELKNELPIKLLREERDRRLKETDWRASSDLNLPESWRAYRQALRDLPANAKPKLDENDKLDMSSVAWPSPST